jgi:hypothetical protein
MWIRKRQNLRKLLLAGREREAMLRCPGQKRDDDGPSL